MVTNPNSPPIDPPCSTIVYRLILRPSWIDPDDNTRLKAEAFMRRPPRMSKDGSTDPMDSDGLSVFDSYWIKAQDCVKTMDCHGLATLHVGTLLNLGLVVIRDPEDDRKILITNIPFENPADADQELLLDQVAASARIVLRGKYKRED